MSALEIEEVLRCHPSVLECAVVGVADPVWGERVAVGVEVRGEGNLELDDLRLWAKERLASYKVPTRLLLLEQLPRNPMGKVVKPRLRALVEQAETSSSGPGLR